MSYEEFVKNRITELRLKENLSEYALSQKLGHSKGYIYNISSGRALPPLKEFFEICRYFKISPQQFFAEEIEDPQMDAQVMEGFRKLPAEDQQTILNLINSLNKANSAE